MTLVHSGQEAVVPTEQAEKPASHKWALVSEPLDYLDGIQSGLIIKKESGAPVAYLFNHAEAVLAASAPDLLEAATGLLKAYRALVAIHGDDAFADALGHPASWASRTEAAIARATGVSA